jgi:hypothetical protein
MDKAAEDANADSVRVVAQNRNKHRVSSVVA